MREWKYRRIINKILPCTLCPCKTGHFQVWLQSTATLWRGAPYAPILYLENFLPRFSSFLTICFFLILYISFSSCPAQAAGSKLLAQLPFVVFFFVWFFVGFVLFFYLLWQVVFTTISLLSILSFLPNTHFQSSRGFQHHTGTPPF